MADATLTPEELEAVRKPATAASSLPPRAYTDPEVYALEVERIFMKEWLCVGRTDQIPKPGDYFTIDLVGEPLVVARDKEGRLRVLSRVCRHRWMSVVEGSGNTNSFQCPYHSWTYGLDGRLIGAPEMEQAEAFSRSDCHLPEVRSEIWQGFIFCNFDSDAAPLAPGLTTLESVLAAYQLPEMRAVAPLEYESHWNWKVMVENGSESYHHLGAHRKTVEGMFPARLTDIGDNDGPYLAYWNPTADGSPIADPFPIPDGLSRRQRNGLLICCVFPCHVFFVLPGHMGWLHLVPESIKHHSVRFTLCVPPAALEDPEAPQKIEAMRQIFDAIHREDMDSCRGVQRGLESRLAEPARLSHLEKSIWQFHQWWLERMAP
ncbi:MAG: aromatic ring-hydroxylating dioxygenase subunit alpha [Myxococcota bacterium]